MIVRPGSLRAKKTIFADGLRVLRKYGTDAHAYIFGIGTINGLSAGNYLDSAGITPATLDGLIGRTNDAAQGLGAELVTNGDFSAGTTGWTAQNSTITATTGEVCVTNVGLDYGQARATLFNVTAGKTYKVSFTARLGTVNAGWVVVTSVGTTNISVLTTVATPYSQHIVAGGATMQIACQNNNTLDGGTAYYDNISVREVIGIHATQATTANKPIERKGAVNLLTYSEDFSNAAWTKIVVGTGVTPVVTNNYGVAPNGTTTAARIQLDLGATPATAVSRILQTVTTSSTSNIAGIWAKTTDGTTKTVELVSTNKTITGTWTFFSEITFLEMNIRLRGAVGTSNTADILVWHPMLEVGTTASPYVATTTAPASNGIGNSYAEFDGTKYLTLSAVPFQMADDSVNIACFKSTGSNANQFVSCPSGDTTALSLKRISALTCNALSVNTTAGWYDGTTFNFVNMPTASGFAVYTSAKISATGYGRKNGVQIGSTPITATFTANGGAIGGTPSGGNCVSGNLACNIIIKGTVTDADLLTLERFAGLFGSVNF